MNSNIKVNYKNKLLKKKNWLMLQNRSVCKQPFKEVEFQILDQSESIQDTKLKDRTVNIIILFQYIPM